MSAGAAASIVEEFDALVRLAHAPVSDADQLVASLGTIYRRLFTVDLQRFDLEEARVAAPLLVARLFELRLGLRARVEEWWRQGLMAPEAQKVLRDVFRASRYAADMLGELAIDHARLADGEGPYPMFSGPGTQTDVNARHANVAGEFQFQSGDVILERGSAHNSAAIARIGDVDSQFSHVAIVHIDARGNTWVVESLIEDGAVITPLDKHLTHGTGRAILFRHRDREVAARAAAQIYDLVAWSLESPRRRILYDFTMRLEGRSTLFCSKLVRLAYEMGSEGRIKLPTFPSKLLMKNADFFARIGVTATETFAPGDIELDPLFDVVAEWRDWRLTSRLRQQDMIMTKLLAWMDEHDMVFKETFAVRLIAWLGRLSSFLSEDAKSLMASVVPKVPINMGRRTIATVAMLHKTAEPLVEHLQGIEASIIDRTGKPMHPRLMLAELEAFRERQGNHIGYLVPRGE